MIPSRTAPREVQLFGSRLYYHPDTPRRVVQICEDYNHDHRYGGPKENTRLIFVYGDAETGEPWGDPPYYGSTDTGYVCSSTGPVKIPIAVYNKRSYGGGAILTRCVVLVMTARGKIVIYCKKDPRKEFQRWEHY